MSLLSTPATAVIPMMSLLPAMKVNKYFMTLAFALLFLTTHLVKHNVILVLDS